MDYFAGLDVSVKETSICIVDDAGKIVREVKMASEPEALLQVLTNPAYHFKRIGLEAGPLSQWLFSALAEMGLPVICVETRHIQSLQSIDTTSVGSILNGPDFGDVFLRTKMNLFGNDAGPVTANTEISVSSAGRCRRPSVVAGATRPSATLLELGWARRRGGGRGHP
jgi:hypothetical protein